MPVASSLLKAFSVSKKAVVLVLFRAWRLATLSQRHSLVFCGVCPIPKASLLLGLRILPRPLGQVSRPGVDQDSPGVAQVRPSIGRLDPVADDMRQGRLDYLPGMVCLQPFGKTGHGPVSRRRGDESQQEAGPPNEPGMIDDFRLWGARRCRHIHAPPNKTRRRVQVARAFNNRNAFLSEGAPRCCGLGRSRNAASDAGQHGFPTSAAERRSEAAPRVCPPRPA